MVKILASDGMQADAIAALKEAGHEVDVQFYEPEELKEAVKKYNVLVVRSATKVREPHIDAALETGELKLVIRGGVGIDNIDHKYAESKGIAVRNTPAASSASVAELALGHMFSLARYIGISNATMRNGEWNKKKYEGTELGGKTLGLIGCGRIAPNHIAAAMNNADELELCAVCDPVAERMEEVLLGVKVIVDGIRCRTRSAARRTSAPGIRGRAPRARCGTPHPCRVSRSAARTWVADP